MKAFVKRGDDVIVKPNICTGYHGPEYAATTNPDVVGALVGLCLAAGAGRVRVMDSPFGSQADEAYKNSGIQAAVEKAGGHMEFMAPAKFRDYTIPAGLDIKQWPIYSGILSYVLGVILDMVQRDRCRSARSSWRLTILFFDVFVPAPPRADLGAPAPGACLWRLLDSLGQTLQRGPHAVVVRTLEPVDSE